MTITTNGSGIIFTQGMGTVTSEDFNKDSQSFYMNIPMSDSDESFALPALLGVTRTIKIAGIFTANDGDIETFLDELNSLIDGGSATRKYMSDTTGHTYYVLVDTVGWKKSEGDVNLVNWDVSMTECARVD
jgi:hypothetical protein